MRKETINYTLVGAFVSAMLAILLVAVYMIMGRSGPTDDYYVEYQLVTGLKTGTPVYFEGYPVGQVESIQPVRADGNVNYRVDISISEGWQIPQDSLAVMTATGLLSALSINIHEGSSREYLSPGARIDGAEGGDMFKVFNKVALDLNQLANTSLKPLLDNLNTQVTRFSSRIEGDGGLLVGEVKRLIASLNESADGLRALLDERNRDDIRAVIVHARSASQNLEDLTALASDTTRSATRLIDGMHETRDQVGRLLSDVDAMVVENRPQLNDALQHLQRSLAAVSERVDQLTYHMEGTARNMHEFSRQIRENPGLLLGSKPPSEKENPAP